MTFADPPAATVPLVALGVKTPSPVLSPLHVRVLLPLLLIVSVVVVFAPTCTSPNARVPDSSITRVGVGVGVGVGEGVGVWVDVGAVGGAASPPEQELVTAPAASSAATNTLNNHRLRTLMLVINMSLALSLTMSMFFNIAASASRHTGENISETLRVLLGSPDALSQDAQVR